MEASDIGYFDFSLYIKKSKFWWKIKYSGEKQTNFYSKILLFCRNFAEHPNLVSCSNPAGFIWVTTLIIFEHYHSSQTRQKNNNANSTPSGIRRYSHLKRKFIWPTGELESIRVFSIIHHDLKKSDCYWY